MPTNKRKSYFFILILFVLLNGGCALLPDNRGSNAPSALSGPTPTAIPTAIVPTKPVYTVERGTVVERVQFTGRVAPIIEESLFFQTSGRVRQIMVERNESVSAGEVLADLEIDYLERDLAAARLTLSQAEAQLTEAEKVLADRLTRAMLNLTLAETQLAQSEQDHIYALSRAEIDLNTKQLQLAKLKNQDPAPQEVIAETNLEEARLSLAQAQQAYNRIAYADSVGSSSQAVALQAATLAFEKAEANYTLTMQNIKNYTYDLALLQQQVMLAELEIDRLQKSGPNPQLVQAVELARLEVETLERGVDPILKGNVEQARLSIETLEATIDEARIVAPFDGEILTLSLSEGRDVEAYKPVIVIADPSGLEVSADPGSEQLRQLAEGMPLIVEPISRPGEVISGTIRQLPYPYGGGSSNDVEDEDEATHISLSTSLEDLDLERGDRMQIEIVLARKQAVLWLPPQAIRTFDGRKFVVVQNGEAQQRVDIKIGLEGEDRVEIEEGLTEGMTIIGP